MIKTKHRNWISQKLSSKHKRLKGFEQMKYGRKLPQHYRKIFQYFFRLICKWKSAVKETKVNLSFDLVSDQYFNFIDFTDYCQNVCLWAIYHPMPQANQSKYLGFLYTVRMTITKLKTKFLTSLQRRIFVCHREKYYFQVLVLRRANVRENFWQLTTCIVTVFTFLFLGYRIDSPNRKFQSNLLEDSTIKKLGKGSYGTVVLGSWRGERVAIKVIRRRPSIENEKNALLLRHENVTKIKEIIDEQDDDEKSNAILVLEYVGQHSMQALIEQNPTKLTSKLTKRWNCPLF